MGLKPELKPGLIVLFCGLAGVVFAGIEKIMYDEGITLLTSFISDTLTLTDLMAGTIILWIVIGILVAVATS